MKRTLIHSIAAILIVAASWAIWHWRFVADPGALPETKIAKPPVGWTSASHEQHEVVIDDGKPLLRLHRGSPKEKAPGIRIWYGPLENVRFIHVRCESRWQDVVRGPHPWSIARFTANMRDPNGKIMHPPVPPVFGGTGSQSWKKNEVVFKLTSDMEDFGFAIAMHGSNGTLEVRNLSIVAVRQRPWIRAATIFVVLSGLALFTSLIRSHPNRPPFGRSLLAACVLVIATWILVFPQTKGFLYPIPSTFSVGEINPPPAPPAKPTTPAVKPATPEPAPPEKPPTPPQIAAEPTQAKAEQPPATPEPAPRDSGLLYRTLREIDNLVGPAHLFLFTGLTLLILIITGQGSQWRLPLALALLSEIIPELTDHLGGWDDWGDLITNILGVGLAVLVWLRLPFLKRFQQTPSD